MKKTVGAVVDELLKRGCEVIYESMYEVHVSGHACQEELKIIQGITKPKFFIPFHGEQKHLRKNADTAISMGDGPLPCLHWRHRRRSGIKSGLYEEAYLGSCGPHFGGWFGRRRCRQYCFGDRKHLAEDGLIVVVCTIDDNGQVVAGPDVVSRGFVYVREAEPFDR